MSRSLRFRLPALFLAGIAAAGIVSVAIAFQLLQSYSRTQSLKELRREAAGLNQLISTQAKFVSDNAPQTIPLDPPQLEAATGAKIYYYGVSAFPGSGNAGLRTLPADAVGKIDITRIRAGHTQSFDFTPPGGPNLIAVAGPFEVEGATLGALVVAKPATELQDTWVTLMKFFAVSILGGLLVAGILSWY